MFKLGLIGCGAISNSHIAAYRALPDLVTVSAVCDANMEAAEKVAQIFGADVYTSAEELVKNADVKAVDICLPTFLHKEIACLAMNAGKHVFLEKPICLTKTEAQEILNCALKNNAKVQVGQVLRFWDEYAWLYESYQKREYGEILSAEFNRLSLAPAWAAGSWFSDPKKSGSVAIDLHIHDVDFIRYLMGEPKEVYSVPRRTKEGLLIAIKTIYNYQTAYAASEACWDYPKELGFVMEYRVVFENATIIYSSKNSPTLTIYQNDGTSFSPTFEKNFIHNETTAYISDSTGFYNELKAFCQSIDQDLPIQNASLEDTVKSHLLALQEVDFVGGVIK